MVYSVILAIMRRFNLILFGVLILSSVGFGLAQLEEIRNLRQSLSALDQERSALKKRLWDLQKRNGELEGRLTRASSTPTLVNAAGEPAGGLPPGGDSAASQPPRGRFDNGRFASIMASPEVQKLMAMQQKGALDGRYASLFKQLQLSPADLEKFKNLLVEKQASVMDVLATARADGLTGPDSRDQVRQLVQDAQAEVENNIRSTLGDAAYAQYQNFETTAPQRNVVSQLEQRLSYSTTPLTDTQSAQLVQILSQTAPPSGSNTGSGGMVSLLGGAFRGGGGLLPGGNSPITSDAISQAQSILSAQQLAALQTLQQEQQASAQLRQQLRAGFGGQTQGTAAAGATSPPRPGGP